MILPRVIPHLREQEWTAIAIDSLTVVVGVFVGLQVNNWTEARSERAREAFAIASSRSEDASLRQVREIQRLLGDQRLDEVRRR